MKRYLALVILMCLVLSLVACGNSTEKQQGTTVPFEETSNTENQEIIPETSLTHDTEPSETEPVLEYFESDIAINAFFENYNEIATNKIDADLIEKGNIKTKAIVYANNFSLEVINTTDGVLSISIETEPDNEDNVMLAVFSDCIRAMHPFSNDEIEDAWSAIHETGYMVEGYDFNGIIITYVPSKELSWGTNNPRVDLSISLE